MSLSDALWDSVAINSELVDVRSFPSWNYYRRWERRMYGSWWLTRFWYQRVRPWLAPKRQGQIESRYGDAQARRRREFMNAILERGDK